MSHPATANSASFISITEPNSSNPIRVHCSGAEVFERFGRRLKAETSLLSS
jgi:hypothetical protein